MKKFAFLLFPLAGIAACQPSPPPPPPAPQTTEIIGTVIELGGDCHTIRADNGSSYAVRPGALPPNAGPGARVRVVGVIDPSQGCPGRTLLRADGGITVLADAGPPPRRGRRPITVPK